MRLRGLTRSCIRASSLGKTLRQSGGLRDSPKNLRTVLAEDPVAGDDRAVERVRPYADELVCLSTPVFFQAVSQFYREFPQVEDAEAERILSEARKEASGGA